MITSSIKNVNVFKIKDMKDNSIFYGTNQIWYKKRWQRMSGCGPCAVTNIIHYLNQMGKPGTDNGYCLTKEECIELMEETWQYVTPSLGGISSTKHLGMGINRYLTSKSINLKLDFLDIPKNKSSRPAFDQVVLFLDQALKKDTPVAFLNLHNGTAASLESWHWVTIVSLTVFESGESVKIDMLDQGEIKSIDLYEWYQSTKLGGGFVSFEPIHK